MKIMNLMLISLKSLLMKGDHTNDFSHQYLFKTQPKEKCLKMLGFYISYNKGIGGMVL